MSFRSEKAPPPSFLCATSLDDVRRFLKKTVGGSVGTPQFPYPLFGNRPGYEEGVFVVICSGWTAKRYAGPPLPRSDVVWSLSACVCWRWFLSMGSESKKWMVYEKRKIVR